MKDSKVDQERFEDKVSLILKVNYVSSALALVFGLVCYFALNITQIIPFVFVVFGVFNLVNTWAFHKHNKIVITYNISSIMALISAFIITIYSGGINS